MRPSRFARLPDLGGQASNVGPAGLPGQAPPALRGDRTVVPPTGLALPEPWWEPVIRAGLPAPRSPWRSGVIPAGIWLYRGSPAAKEAALVAGLPADPERLALVVGAVEPDASCWDALAQVLAGLPADSERAVRLFLPRVAVDRACAIAKEHSLDLVAAPAELSLRGGITYATGHDVRRPEWFPQWYRTRCGAPVEPFGALYPPPCWEAVLSDAGSGCAVATASVSRVPAGFAVRPLGGTDLDFMAFAAQVPASAQRLRLVVQGSGVEPLLLAACSALLEELPAAATRQVELVWPYAGAREATQALADLARECDGHIIAPAAGFATASGDHELVALHVDGAMGHWVRFGADGTAQPHGPLSPAPRWGPLLHRRLAALPAGLEVEQAPSGVHLRGPGPDQSTLAAMVVPDRGGVTVVADGDARSQSDRDRVLALLRLLEAPLHKRLRLVMSAAGDGGPQSFAQLVADQLRARVLVASAESMDRATRAAGTASLASLDWDRYQPGAARDRLTVRVVPAAVPHGAPEQG